MRWSQKLYIGLLCFYNTFFDILYLRIPCATPTPTSRKRKYGLRTSIDLTDLTHLKHCQHVKKCKKKH